ncbi:MAG TPA: hypothetical protein VGD37_00650 [Kofleriaceae bacterium]|jgi:hypothetical protein
MDRSQDEPLHSAVVDAWIQRTIENGSSFEVVDLFGAALEALWTRAVMALGSVTLTAIVERVLGTAAGRYPFLSVINPRPNGDARWRQQLAERLTSVPRLALVEGLRFALIELLTVIGRLTAEILSPELHAAIMEVASGTREVVPPAGFSDVPATASGKLLS